MQARPSTATGLRDLMGAGCGVGSRGWSRGGGLVI
jgi:hypothetical protein